MYIKLNTLVAIYVHVSWQTSFSFKEFADYTQFMQTIYWRHGEPMRILLSDSLPKEYDEDIHYIFDSEKQVIRCPDGIGVKESYQYLQKVLPQSNIDELSKNTQRYFDNKYPKDEMQH